MRENLFVKLELYYGKDQSTSQSLEVGRGGGWAAGIVSFLLTNPFPRSSGSGGSVSLTESNSFPILGSALYWHSLVPTAQM